MSPAYTKIAKIKANQVRVELPHCCNRKQFIEPIDMLTWFEIIGYRALLHDDIQRSSSNQVVLWDYLKSALTQINSDIPKIAIEAAISKVAYTSPEIIANLRFHQLLLNGVDVEYKLDGQIINQKVRLVDTCNLLKNDWVVIHKFTVGESNYTYNLDAVIFINGLPLAIILRADSEYRETLKQAYLRLQSYQQLLPKLFFYNVFLVITCKNQAKVGTLTSSLRDFVPWCIDGEGWTYGESSIEVLIQGLFDKRQFFELIKHSVVFEENQSCITKKLLRYPFCTIPKS
ncbi:type I site-specific deoxyribonuclease chain R [Calothrix sp. NIES-4071]|nr:type I site-specific deoxyribonuclease chain R [Calothrix sp. NIES-4071]BAZ55261.1 type I site-specific deoxyribonuclease chain R [Calothrix sp. NIES-4105]